MSEKANATFFRFAKGAVAAIAVSVGASLLNQCGGWVAIATAVGTGALLGAEKFLTWKSDQA